MCQTGSRRGMQWKGSVQAYTSVPLGILYTQNRRSILKKTYWYQMDCTNDSGMKPQQEEGIDDNQMVFRDRGQDSFDRFLSFHAVFI